MVGSQTDKTVIGPQIDKRDAKNARVSVRCSLKFQIFINSMFHKRRFDNSLDLMTLFHNTSNYMYTVSGETKARPNIKKS